ncbi:hypothetical protein [Dongshaea marina]|uniref:hypothetical protein n=1 Tax=Dongshaea marina TaxID=2047966 RepID=UPI000D3EE13C|nr:hypothetical protein [Dongshaea marina]
MHNLNQVGAGVIQRYEPNINTDSPSLMMLNKPEEFLKENKVYFPVLSSGAVVGSENIGLNTIKIVAYPSPDDDYDGAALFVQPEKDCDPHDCVNVLYTPMRSPDSPFRLEETNKCRPGDNHLWTTDTQSGCIVCILNWGKSDGQNEYSMLHLQPRDGEELPENPEELIKNEPLVYSNMQDARIEVDIFKVLDKMIPEDGVKPESYAFIHSSEGFLSNNMETNVIGVSNDDSFSFFKQTSVQGTMYPKSVEPIEFLTWPER